MAEQALDGVTATGHGNLAQGFDAQMPTPCCWLCVSNNVLSLWRLWMGLLSASTRWWRPDALACNWVTQETLGDTCRTSFPRRASGVGMI